MAAPQLDSGRVDRSAFKVTTFEAAEREDREYWRSRSPEERLAALELSRQIAYGYDPTARGLSRFFDFVTIVRELDRHPGGEREPAEENIKEIARLARKHRKR